MTEKKEGIFKYPVVFSFMAIIAAIEFIRMSLFITLLPSFLMNLGFTTAALGVVISANLLADNLSKSAIGWLVDHKGPWPVLFFGSLMALTGVLFIMYFHQSLVLLFLAAILIGIGVAPTWPAAIAGSIQTVGENKRATMISIISVVWLSGGGIGPILMGFLIDPKSRKILQQLNLPLFDAYRTCFQILLTIAITAVIVCLVGWWNWYRVPHLQQAIAERNQSPPLKRLREVLRRLWKVKGLIPGMFFQTLSLGMLLPNLLPYATKQLGLSESQYSMLLLIGGAVVVAFMIPVGHLADRRGSRGFLASGFLLAAVSLFILATYGNARNVWFIVGFVGLSYALIQPAWNALLAGAIPPEQRGVLMGLFMAAEGIGFAVGPMIGGYLGTYSHTFPEAIAKTGPALPFYISSICLIIMALVYLLYPFHRYQIEGD
ncbi:MAG TPA: MFS transporter [Bacillota bacterium]|nr:MFS transporter [Bacillota bacterium]